MLFVSSPTGFSRIIDTRRRTVALAVPMSNKLFITEEPVTPVRLMQNMNVETGMRDERQSNYKRALYFFIMFFYIKKNYNF